MKKNLIIVGMVFLLIFVLLSGCGEESTDIDNGEWPEFEPINHIQIGDTVNMDGIDYTFERVYTGVRFIDEFKIFTIQINCTNVGSFIGSFDESGYVRAIKYKMEDGTKYDAPLSTNSTASFTLSPGENKKSYIYLSEDELKIDYSKIAEVYLIIGGIDRVLDIK
jgi:hypothetical protein